MRLSFRLACAADIAQIVALLRDDVLGAGREGRDTGPYLAAFERMSHQPGNDVIVGVADDGRIVATYHLTIFDGLTLGAMRRAQLEGVRVASALRGLGLGRQLIADAEARARHAGCGMLQLTMNASRRDSAQFYAALGFQATHTGYKRMLTPQA